MLRLLTETRNEGEILHPHLP